MASSNPAPWWVRILIAIGFVLGVVLAIRGERHPPWIANTSWVGFLIGATIYGFLGGYIAFLAGMFGFIFFVMGSTVGAKAKSTPPAAAQHFPVDLQRIEKDGYSLNLKHAIYLGKPVTEIELAVELPQRLVLDVRLQTPEEAKAIAREDVVDITVGDPVVDARYVIEGAPTALVERAFDEAIRTELRRAGPIHLTYEPGSGFRLVCSGTLDPGTADALTDLLVHVAASFERASMERQVRVDTGYRASARTDSVEDEAEIATLEELRKRRSDT